MLRTRFDLLSYSCLINTPLTVLVAVILNSKVSAEVDGMIKLLMIDGSL